MATDDRCELRLAGWLAGWMDGAERAIEGELAGVGCGKVR